jgi:hypothetical protein
MCAPAHACLSARQASVALLCELGMYLDAVALALTFDMGLAADVANRPEDNAALQRQLWLAIARHVISQPGPDVRLRPAPPIAHRTLPVPD